MTMPHKSSPPVQYRITLRECLDATWSDGFEQMDISVEGGRTILTGPVADQAALHGLLNRVRDLNLNLLSVERMTPGPADRQ